MCECNNGVEVSYNRMEERTGRKILEREREKDNMRKRKRGARRKCMDKRKDGFQSLHSGRTVLFIVLLKNN